MEEKRMTEQESLTIITQMITNAQANLRSRIDSNMLLGWGYVTIAVAIGVWFVKTYYPFPYSSFLWLIVPAICFPLSIYARRKQKVYTKSYIDRLIENLAIIFFVATMIVSLPTICFTYPVFFMVTLLFSIMTWFIGIVIKEKIIIGGGITGMILSLSLLFIQNENDQILAFIVFVITVFIIPVHLFRYNTEKNNSLCSKS